MYNPLIPLYQSPQLRTQVLRPYTQKKLDEVMRDFCSNYGAWTKLTTGNKGMLHKAIF